MSKISAPCAPSAVGHSWRFCSFCRTDYKHDPNVPHECKENVLRVGLDRYQRRLHTPDEAGSIPAPATNLARAIEQRFGSGTDAIKAPGTVGRGGKQQPPRQGQTKPTAGRPRREDRTGR